MSQSLDRALRILPLLAEGPAGLEQVARHIEAHKSTALRLLRTLHAHGLVHRQPDQRYRLGSQLFALAHRAAEQLDVREIAHPHLLELNERTGHTVHLAIREEDRVLYIDKVESRHPVRMYSRIGREVAVTVAAVAKVLLADLPTAEREALVRRLAYPRYTSRSVTGPPELLAELVTVRERGWATDLGGHEESVNCVAAPVRGHDGRVVAALSVSVPIVVADERAVLALLPEVRQTARAVTDAYTGRTTPPALARPTASAAAPAPDPVPRRPEPGTSEPETSGPKTSGPGTSGPETSRPETHPPDGRRAAISDDDGPPPTGG
ncbi:IclR family transcriptional regulator [Streptomyces lonarensis]|uniref:IclR family transcriptional regulator n=1 Tax=Streptomyces lonarensis TaxID=700599 RepID=A0A7X6D4D3_9ACTN|nr:IclR family transcriptional regulator [Streptomyces lonarensis]